MRAAAGLRGWALATALLLGGLGVAACGGGSDDATVASTTPAGSPLSEAGDESAYLALGDSYAAGVGASDAATTSYAALFWQELRQRFPSLELVNLAVGGHTSRDLLDEQLPSALDAIQGGGVRAVTISIGGNYLMVLGLNEECMRDPTGAACPLGDALVEVEANLGRALAELRAAAGPDVPVVIMTYPNMFSVPGHPFEEPAALALGRLNEVVRAVARRYDVPVAELSGAFDGRADELTHVAETPVDPHPNDAGHRVIAEAFVEAMALH
jgi:lysophospholipase L1-like esterase